MTEKQTQLVLFDSSGRPRIVLDADEVFPHLSMYDNDGYERMQIGIDHKGDATICLRDQSGRCRVNLGVDGDKCGIIMHGSCGVPSINVTIHDPGVVPSIEVRNNNNQPMLLLWSGAPVQEFCVPPTTEKTD